MQLLVLVLNRTQFLEPLLKRLAETGICGATVLDSTGMAHMLYQDHEELPFLGGLRRLISPDRNVSKTIFMVLDDARVDEVRRIIIDVTGGLDQPDSGIMFAVPTTFTEGIDKKQ